MLSAARFHFDAADAFSCNVRAYDIDADKVDACRRRIGQMGFRDTGNIMVADFLKEKVPMADIVIGNPPYIRYENIPVEMLEYCKSHFHTFYYRSDLYVPFFEKTLSLLKKGGKHCFICSNRWLKNEYGKKLRQYISDSFRLLLLINMEGSDAFQENVLAYPAVTLISAEAPYGSFEFAECDDKLALGGLKTVMKTMPVGDDWTDVYMETTQYSDLLPIERQNFKIGIGVATGADAVFVSDKLMDEVERELVLPAVNARDLKGDKLQWRRKYLLSPYTSTGRLINLDCYPKARKYLERHKETLMNRYVVRRSPACWYRTIDRIVPSVKQQPKILLPDMSGNSCIFVDEGRFYPLHNIYYITGNTVTELRLLSAMLMSDFVREQLASVTNKMNGGFVRWQSQYLRKLRLPEIRAIAPTDAQTLLDCYGKKDIQAINVIMSRILASQKDTRKEYASEGRRLDYAFK